MLGRLLLGIFSVLLLSCSPAPVHPPLKVGFNTWPGYEFIYLAHVKNFYAEQGISVKLVELNSLGDVRRAFERGQIDIMASSLVELVTAAESSGIKLTPIAVTDASRGADKLITRKTISQLSELQGKRLGAEPGTVDTLVAAAALRLGKLTLDQVTFEFASQDDLVAKLEAGEIDALQTYPPYSNRLLANSDFHVLFDTQQIPGEIIDVLSVRQTLIHERGAELTKFLHAYFNAVEFFHHNKTESAQIMAQREGLSTADFLDAIESMTIYSREDQDQLLKGKTIKTTIQNTLDVLHAHGWLTSAMTADDFFVGHP